MIVCKKQMQCVHNGSRIMYNKMTHIYPGDTFKCTECGIEVVNTAGTPAYSPGIDSAIKYEPKWDILMDK